MRTILLPKVSSSFAAVCATAFLLSSAVAKEQKIQFMFDRNDQILVLLYGDPKYDYTNFVIDRLKRGGSSK